MLVRLTICFVLALTLAACADQPTASAPTAQPEAQAPTQPTIPTLAPSATPPPTAPPIAVPIATIGISPEPATSTSEPATLTPIATATATTPAIAETSVSKARHVFPVQNAKVSYGRFHHDYPAADIFCPIGSEFVAVTDGVVDYVSSEDVWDPKMNDGATRGGLSVAIIGDDGVRYYGSHLSQIAHGIAPGVRVVVGQQLGLTGKSGDARYTDAHLHFGISHPTTPEDWAVRRGEIPPYNYLRAWQRGEDATPKVTR